MTGLLGEARATAGATPHLDGLLSGQSELSDHGEVEIAGRVNASGEVRILARSIDATGTVWVADGAHGASTGGAVNTGDDDTFQLIEAEGRILLAAADSLVVGGTVHAEGGDVLLQAGEEASIAAGAVVSARDLGGQLTGGNDAALSGGDSGSVLVTGRDIRVAAGARIEADADGAHSGGDIDLYASDLAGGQTGRFTASSSVHADGILRGSDIRMSATSVADSSWTDPDADLLTVAANELVEIAQKAGSELGGTLGYLATDTRAEVVIGANADIIAAGDVTALARTGQTLETGVTGLKGGDQLQDYVSVGAMWADLDTVATAKVESGASIDAGGTLAIKAETDSKVDIAATSFAADGTAVAMTLAISTIDIQADATIEAGVDLQVGSLDVGALNTSSFSTAAKAHSDEEGAVGLAAAVSLQDVSADAWLGSGLDTVGDVTVQAASLTSRNAMEAAVSAPPEDKEEPAAEGGGESDGDSAIAGLMGQGFDKLSGVLGSQGGDDETGDSGGSTPSTFRLGGAMTYLEGDRAASAKIGDAAEVTAGGDVSVHADVEHSGISIIAGTAIAAQGKNDDGSALSLSAGVSLTDLGHDAEAEIGAGVVVDAQRIGVGSEIVL
ncbi:MAG: hypothetical protein GX805_00285, partial [Gammaproteobacteria bacterium]|nr:hypothetical protein [Gammaproteobacteria bacterium]